jgi:hypothetical protein
MCSRRSTNSLPALARSVPFAAPDKSAHMIAATGAADRKASMATHKRPNPRDFDLVIFADQFPLVTGAKRKMKTSARARAITVIQHSQGSRMTFLSYYWNNSSLYSRLFIAL